MITTIDQRHWHCGFTPDGERDEGHRRVASDYLADTAYRDWESAWAAMNDALFAMERAADEHVADERDGQGLGKVVVSGR